MILHCVFLNFKPAYGRAERLAAMQALIALIPLVDGLEAIQYGRNIDLEGKSPGHGDGFIASFTDRAALETYAAHPDHQRLGARLVEMCEGGADGIIVYDIETA